MSTVMLVLTFFICLLWHCAGMLAYKTISGTKSFKKAVHLTLQFLSLILSLIGVWAAWKFHIDKGIDNFYSLHSWLGLACLFLFSIQVPLLFQLHATTSGSIYLWLWVKILDPFYLSFSHFNKVFIINFSILPFI